MLRKNHVRLEKTGFSVRSRSEFVISADEKTSIQARRRVTLEIWVSNRWLEKLESDSAEIERLFQSADGHISDFHKAVVSGISSDTQLSLAYDVIRASATAALGCGGYRVIRGGGTEHYRTIEALEFSIDPGRKLIPKLYALRRKRNTGAYDDYALVSQGEADLAGKLAAQVRKQIEDWIRRNHPDKITSSKGEVPRSATERVKEFLVIAAAQKIAAIETERFFEEGKGRVDRKAFRCILNPKVGEARQREDAIA